MNEGAKENDILLMVTEDENVFLIHASRVLTVNHPGLAEINAPVGPQEVMPLLKDSPLKTIAQCRLGQPISNTWMQVGPMMSLFQL